jgi:hypothetical protein
VHVDGHPGDLNEIADRVGTLSGSLDRDLAPDASTIRLLLPTETGWPITD